MTPRDELRFDVFISYSGDPQQAIPVVTALRTLGYRIFFDKDRAAAGSLVINEMRDKIAESACVVALWSRKYHSSSWAMFEAISALNADKLIPVFSETGVELQGPFKAYIAGSIVGWDGNPTSLDPKIIRGINRLSNRDNQPLALYQDIVNGEKSGELSGSLIATILRKEYESFHDALMLATSVEYDWKRLHFSMHGIDELEQKMDRDNRFSDPFDVAVVAAQTAILVAGAIRRSSQAAIFVARICEAVFVAFGLKLNLSQIEQNVLYRNAIDASRVPNVFNDDVLLVLKNAAYIANPD